MSSYKLDWKTKVFFRFLKERNLLHAYLRNFRDPKTRLARDKMVYDVSFFINESIDNFGWIISNTLCFDRTNEGFDFWRDIHWQFHNFFLEQWGKN